MKSKKKKQSKNDEWIRPKNDCPICKGLGIQYFADWFDRDNGTPCPMCQAWAIKQNKKLILPYTR